MKEALEKFIINIGTTIELSTLPVDINWQGREKICEIISSLRPVPGVVQLSLIEDSRGSHQADFSRLTQIS